MRKLTALVAAALVYVAPVATSAQRVEIPSGPTTRPGSAPAALSLTLDAAVTMALRNSKGLGIAAEAVRKARGVVAETRAGYKPSLGATATFTHYDQGTTLALTGTNGQTTEIPTVLQDQKAVAVTALLPIDISGLIRSAVQASQFQEIAARLEYNTRRNQTVLDVKDSYYDVLRGVASVDVAEMALKNSRDRETTADAYLRAGTGTRFDVLRAQTDVANAQQNAIAARNGLKLAIAALNNVLGIDQNTPTAVKEAQEPEHAPFDFNTGIAEAYGNRPEVLQTDADVKAAEKGVAIARRSYLPTFGLNWTFQYTPDGGAFAPRDKTWSAIAQMTVPLYDQGLARARVQQAHADVDASKLAKQQVLDGVALEVRRYSLALTEAEDRLNVANAALAQAQEQYRLAQVRFNSGVTQTPSSSPLLEISDAQSALTQAQNNLVNARYDVQNALARLDYALGRYAYASDASPGRPAPRQAHVGK